MHNDDIELFHNGIVNACLSAAKVLPHTGNMGGVHGPRDRQRMPGWTDECALLRQKAIMWHNVWRDSGRPRHGQLADIRRLSRARYHRAVRKLKQNEGLLRSQKMAENILNNDSRNFFNEAKKMRGGKGKIPCSVDNVTGNENISNVFANKFNTVFNCVNYSEMEMDSLKSNINALSIERSNDIDSCLIDFSEMDILVKKLKAGKSDGNIGLYSDHIIHGTSTLFSYLTLLFNIMIVHGFSPNDMCVGTMIPIPKGKRINMNISDNFRGICLQSMFCKILDLFILNKESVKLVTSNLQFGFKEKLSASIATAVVTETIDYYLLNDGNVFCVALDATKAFDRVSYIKLFNMLIERNCNIFYIRLLLSMYVNQSIRVRFGDSLSLPFMVTNGVKQGGILSPTLFICYINGLITRLTQASVGCTVGRNYLGCVSYADDLVLLAPNLSALNEMIKICELYAAEYCMKFNGSKSKLIVFDKCPGRFRPDVYLNNEKLDVVDELKYLGHMIYNDRNNPMTEYVKKDFITKANVCLNDFGAISSPIKHTLMERYCYAFYGVTLCDYDSIGFKEICTEWRKIMRRVWRVPPRTHCNLLPHIAECTPPDVFLYQRFTGFYFYGITSCNPIVCNMFNNSIFYPTRMGNNMRHVLEKIDLTTSHINLLCVSNIKKSFTQYWGNTILESDVYRGQQIRHLINQRDSLSDWLLSKQQCQDIVNVLCIE
jgi:hypothetical protein